MTKPQNILSEVARVREIMGLQNITEQNNAQIGKTVVIHSGKDEDPIQIIIDRAAKYDVLDDAAENVAGPFIDEVIAKLSGKFDNDLQKAIDSGVTLTKAKIRSGASNFYSRGSTESNVTNDRLTQSPEDQDVKYKKGSKPYKDNLELAKRRGTNFLTYIKAELEKKGVNNLDSLESEDIESVIVDTGGVIDKNRVESDYPNPGQFITMDLIFDKPGKAGEIITECLVDMTILIGYYATADGNLSDGLTSSAPHRCDSAIFDVFLNNEKVFTANLNNLEDPGTNTNEFLTKIQASKEYRVVNPTSPGDNVVCGVEIDNALAQQIMAQSGNDKVIEVGIQGRVEGGSDPESGDKKYVFGGPNAPKIATYEKEPLYIRGKGYHASPAPQGDQLNLHSEVPMVTLRWGDGEQWVGEPNVKLVRGDNSYRKIMDFDVCKREVDGEKINVTTDATVDDS